MSAAAAVLEALRTAGATVGVTGGRLRVVAEEGAIPAALRAQAAAERDGLLALLTADKTQMRPVVQPEHGAPDGVDPGKDLEAETLAGRALALSPEERAAWRLDILHAAVWAAAGKRNDPDLLGDLRALRRMEAPGTCLQCRAPCPADGRFWCDGCAAKCGRATEGQSR